MRVTFMIICIIFSSLCYAQTESDVGLHSENRVEDKDQLSSSALKADSLNELGWSFRNSFPDSTNFYVSKALALALEGEYREREIQSYNYLGIAHRNLGNYSRAFEYYMSAYRQSAEFGQLEQQGYSLINLGNLSIYQSDFQGALAYFLDALKTAEQLGDSTMMAYCYLNLGRTHRSLGQYDEAEKQFLKTLRIRESLGDVPGIITSEADLGEVYRLKKEYEMAIKSFENSLRRAEQIGNIGAVVYSLNNLALICIDLDNLDKAEKYALESLRLARESGLQNDVRKALLSLSVVKELESDFEPALSYHQDYHELTQEIFSEENTRKIERLRAQYEGERQEAENSFLKEQAELNQKVISRQQTIIWLTGAGILLLLAVAIISYKAYQLKNNLSKKILKQKTKIETDKSLIEEQTQKLEELDRAKSRFFANISHDLRSPLSLIMGNLENIKLATENYLTPKSRSDLDVIERNSMRLLHMTDEISDLNKLEEGKLRLNSESISLFPYLESLLNMFDTALSLKSVELKLSAEPGQNYVAKIDPRQFEKVVFNIVGNAIKHTKEGDRITVKLSKTDEEIVLAITDTGEGINTQSLPYIFDRFYQSPDKKYQAREGLGIGLALVKELVELHDGVITVESELDKGTTFTVSLPESKEVPQDARHLPDEETIKRGELLSRLGQEEYNTRNKVNLVDQKTKDASILIVEDHAEIRSYIRDLINDDFTVYEAAHGQEALQMLPKERVDLIITDLMMPWMDGFELLENLAANELYKSIPVLVVSARTSEEDRERVLFHGINDFLQKPFNKTELKLRVRNLLAQKSKWDNGNGAALLQQKADQLDSIEQTLLKKVDQLIIDKIADSNLNIAQLADTMAASERQVYRLIKKLTEKTPLEYIKEVRLQFVDQLIKQGKVKSASQAAREIGMKNVTQFSKIYEKRFGQSPAQLLD
ncbi:MAG: tetratricopeptide repeat protein [Cyclobacteriaceae bacterium]